MTRRKPNLELLGALARTDIQGQTHYVVPGTTPLISYPLARKILHGLHKTGQVQIRASRLPFVQWYCQHEGIPIITHRLTGEVTVIWQGWEAP